MIKYCLKCEECQNIFDSWFSSSKEFDKLKRLNLLSCNICNSTKIKKSLMSPKVLNNKSNSRDENKFKNFKNKIKEYQKFIKNNFDYVGENFAYEARTLHYDSKKKEKGIYGKASKEEIKSLNDEGIEVQSIPWIEDKEN